MTRASTYLRELHAITSAVKRWRQYLLGHFFIIQTYHKSLKEFLSQVIQTPEQQHYLSKLLGYNYKIHYKPGSANKVTDALSWSCEPEPAAFHCLSFPKFVFLDELKRELQAAPSFIDISNQWQQDPDITPGFKLVDNLLIYQGKIWIPPSSRLKELLLKELHESPMGGHAGITKTLKRLAENIFWDQMRKDVQEFINQCVFYQQTKYSSKKPGGLLQPLPIPSNVWEDISMDFITGLPSSQGFTVILVIVDRFSKAIHLGALQSSFTAFKVVELFVSIVCKHHGFPKSIVSDRDPIFISRFWNDLFKLSGTLLLNA